MTDLTPPNRKTGAPIASSKAAAGNRAKLYPAVYTDNMPAQDVRVHTRRTRTMATTRLFRNGNSQAARIPADLAYERTDLEIEIERVGDELRLRPARRRLDHLLEKFNRFSPDFLSGGRDENQEGERDPL